MSSKAQAPAGDLENMVLGAGQIYFNYGELTEASVGATKGGSTFSVERTIRETESDGAYGPVKGHRIKTKIVPRLKIKALEIDKDNLVKFFAGLSATDMTTYFKVRESLDIASSDYLTNVAFVGETVGGDDVVIIVENALGDGNIELAVTKAEEIVPEVQFTGHFDPSTPTTVPYEIRWPVADSAVPTVVTDPTDGASGVALDKTITATFNETMDISTLSTDNIILKQADGTAIPYTLSIDSTHKIVTVLQTSNLPASEDCILLITAGCKDLAQNSVATTWVNFTTAAA